ncbi:MAG TPA: M20/M25/M40 family metallo-hydrolase [Bacteroidia bacterium]
MIKLIRYHFQVSSIIFRYQVKCYLFNVICYLLLVTCYLLPATCVSQTEPSVVLSEYIKYKSVSGNEKPAGLYLKSICEQLGFYTTVFTDADSSYNFCASLVPLDRGLPSVLLINHIDVVPVDEQGIWQHKPYEGIINNDTIYGRGTIDMKGLAVMQMFALRQIKETIKTDSITHNIIILFLSGEETGGKNGAAKMIQPEILAKLKPMVVFGEGGGGLTHVIPGKEKELCFFVSNAEKKSLWLKLEAKVKSRGHSSVSSSKTADRILLKSIEKIDNAEEHIVIDKCAEETFKEIGSIMGGFKGFIVKHINLWIFKPLRRKIVRDNEAIKALVTNSYQLTQIQNPKGPINQVAQSATAYYDCRLLPNKSEKPYILKLLFRIIDRRIKITIEEESPTSEPTALDKNYDKLKASILSVFPTAHVIPVLFPATTDNSYFRSVGIPSYGVLPFILSEEMIESVHANNEKLPLSAITSGIKIYTQLLKSYNP